VPESSSRLGFAATVRVNAVSPAGGDLRAWHRLSVDYRLTGSYSGPFNSKYRPNIMYKISLPEKAYIWGAKFIWQILKEIRKITCTEGHGGLDLTDYKKYPKAV
jgi:hypothetical protein